ncbi:glycosyltransferase 1 domain-containing protein 1 isoform X2 [Echeneis naucrates]|uniref:glycosyltransferase 1 domain-containing protein 1 isoform X2 n=1 Tax=Echeneis naucrates TaxID=173247 RepID=UPI0011136E31|nr:glycosyltransferase 1 domain-containing protein 1 isoform X2 [Echeneis naucrates]
MKLLFLACLSPKTGNHTTADRIRSHIESAGHTCELRDVAEFQSPAEVANLVCQHPPFEGALAIHLYRAGRLLMDVQVPFGVIFGGTDINEDVKVEQKRVVMEQVLRKARFAVAFTDKMKKEAELFLLSNSGKIYVQPQGIQTEVSEKFCWSEFLRSSGVSSKHVDELHVFLLVCGIRRVKDPLYLVKIFSEWHCENPLNVLVIIGPKIDPVFTVELEAVVSSRGLPGPGEEPTGATCCHEKVLRCGQQLQLRGHVGSHLGGYGSRGTCVSQRHSRKCSCGATRLHWPAVCFSSGIRASVSEAAVRP